jgi:chemotaxis protein MotA
MDLSTIIGFIVGVISIFGIACQLEIAPYINIPSIGLVFGGAASSCFMSLPLADVMRMPRIFWQAFKDETFDFEAMIKKMTTFAEVARRDGVLALESQIDEQDDPYVRDGLRFVVDGKSEDIVVEIINVKIDSMQERHDANLLGWKIAQGMAPSWGSMGTVIGLIQMVGGGVEDPNALIMGVATALLATFYGALISTWLAGSVTEKLAARTTVEVRYRNLIKSGLLALQSGEPPRAMEERLRAYMHDSTPQSAAEAA